MEQPQQGIDEGKSSSDQHLEAGQSECGQHDAQQDQGSSDQSVLLKNGVEQQVDALNYLSYTGISIAAVAVVTYLPVILLGLALWYIISKFL